MDGDETQEGVPVIGGVVTQGGVPVIGGNAT